MKKKKKDIKKIIGEAEKIPEIIKSLDEDINGLQERIRYALLRIPNLLHDSVPIGKDEHDNLEVRKFGSPPKFGFEPKNHLDILKGLGLVDDERAEKVTGRGFIYLKGQLALLDRALQSYALDFLIKRGYVFIYPPHMLRRKPYEGMVDLTDFESMMYKIETL